MRMAFTIDDLPVYPHLPYPSTHTPRSIASAIMQALDRHGITGVFAMANSWPLDVEPGLARILDDWVTSGHHVGNHTHSHPLLNDTEADDFVHDITVADKLLAPWISQAPVRAFRHPLDLWGNTEEKRSRVNAHLKTLDYRGADVTSWFHEWEWDRAWQWLLKSGRNDEANTLLHDFIDYAAAQISHDRAICHAQFGHDVVAIGLAHNVPFFAEVADAFFARLISEGVTFVPLEEALEDPAFERSGSVVTDAFALYQIKIGAADGWAYPAIPRQYQDLINRVFDLGKHLRPPRRCMQVQNKRPRPT